jgi:hypothetical protein
MIDVTINDEPMEDVMIIPPWVHPEQGGALVEFDAKEPPPFDYDRTFTIGLFGRTFHAHLVHRTADKHSRHFSMRGDGDFPFTQEEWEIISSE